MTVVVDTSVLIDVLRGEDAALAALKAARAEGIVHASEVSRLEVLAGMRPSEEVATRTLFAALEWHPLDDTIAEIAGGLGRRWLPAHQGIDAADLAIAATADLLHARLFTRNVRHFPMIEGLTAPY